MNQLKAEFGARIPLTDITAARISTWKADKLSAVCPRTGKPYAAASINRPLAALRHLFQLAHEEWGVLSAVPKIRLEKEPQGRIRWLEPDEEVRLLAACAKSRNPELTKIVTIALETGLRKGELLGLTWDRVDLSRSILRLEITETALMTNPTRTMEVVTRLSDLGLHLSIDDFGTGYSSLAYLKRLPVREIKIDKSFVRDMASDENDAVIVRSTIDLGHNLGLEVVAEGVETQEAWEQLVDLGCDLAQGYYMAAPMSVEELEKWLHKSAWGLPNGKDDKAKKEQLARTV